VKRSELRLVAGVALAVLVPAVVLDLAAGEARRAAGLSAAPFAWRRILLAHLAAAVPLGLAVALWLRSLPALAATARWKWMVLGALAAVLGGAASAGIADAVAGSDLGAVPLLLLRSLGAFVLVVPWCVAALDPRPAPEPIPENEEIEGRIPARGSGLPAVAFGVGLGLAVVPCGLYAETVTAALTHEAATLLTQRRLLRAESVVTGLCELGSERPVRMRSPAQVRKWLAATLGALRRQAERPVPASAAPAALLDRAVLLVQLERLDEAAAFLQPLAPGDDTAALMLAAVYRNQQRWPESDGLYASTLEKLLPRARTDEAARGGCRTAFEGLAENARMDRRPAEAEATLHRGLRELPEDAAHFHFLLGRHYHEAGRVGLALDHLRTAARLQPAGFEKPVDDLIRQIRTATPGCLTGGSH
jgi:hypothetical protein